jgi:hypothetical protein
MGVLHTDQESAVFKDANKGNYLESDVTLERQNLLSDNVYIGEISGTLPRNRRPPGSALNRDYFRSGFTEKPCDCPAPRTQLKDGALKMLAQRPKKIRSASREMVERRPVDTIPLQLGGQNREVACPPQNFEQALLESLTIRIG